MSLTVGFLYYCFIEITGIALSCPFYIVTGLYCPGCGVTRMLMAIMKFHWYEAFRSNQFVFCSSPLIIIAILLKSHPAENIISYILIAVALVFGILRNIFPALAPI